MLKIDSAEPLSYEAIKLNFRTNLATTSVRFVSIRKSEAAFMIVELVVAFGQSSASTLVATF